MGARALLPHIHSAKEFDIERYVVIADSLEQLKTHTIEQKKTHKDSIEMFDFDPNNLSRENWLKLGLSSKQINTIKNYEKAGGKFYQKADLKKIYSIDDACYKRLEKYIVIPSKTIKSSNPYSDNKDDPGKKKDIHIEINTADTAKLKKLWGIGPVYAVRIIKYRSLLGGFYSTKQLLEVYGIEQETFEQIRNSLYVDTSEIKKINVNEAEFREILKHPYFDYETTKQIVNEKNNTGPYRSINDLKIRTEIDSTLFNKISPYIATKLYH